MTIEYWGYVLDSMHCDFKCDCNKSAGIYIINATWSLNCNLHLYGFQLVSLSNNFCVTLNSVKIIHTDTKYMNRLVLAMEFRCTCLIKLHMWFISEDGYILGKEVISRN